MYFFRKKIHKSILIISSLTLVVVMILLFSDIGAKKIKPGQEITLTVEPKTDQVDYNSILRIYNEDDIKLKISTDYNKKRWYDSSGKVYYDIESQNKIQVEFSDGKLIKKIIEQDKNENISFENNEFIISFLGEKAFDVTNNKKYAIKIKNMSSYPGKISAYIENN